VDFEIKPRMGAGTIEFGMSPSEVRSQIRATSVPFKRTAEVEFPSDYFKTEGVFAYYDKHGKLEAIEFARPSNPLLDGLALLQVSCDLVKSTLRAKDPAFEEDAAGAVSNAVGVGLYAPNAAEDPTAPCEGIIVFRDGYYD
jgi:hypothetical protein